VRTQIDPAHYHSNYKLEFKGLSVKINKKFILKNIYGVAKPGEMVAIMGPSGKYLIIFIYSVTTSVQ